MRLAIMVVEYILLPLATFLALIFVWWMNYYKLRLPPGPWNLPIVGYLPWLDPEKPHISLTKLADKYGPIYGLYFGNVYAVILSDVNLIKKIQAKFEATGKPLLYLIDLLACNKGLANVQGELWKNQRKFLSTFWNNVGASKLSWNRRNLEEEIRLQASEFVKHVKNKGASAVLDPADALVHSAGSITSIVLLGESYSRDDQSWKSVLTGIHDVMKLIQFAGPLNLWPFLRIIPKYGAQVKAVKQVADRLLDTIEALILKRKKSPQQSRFNIVQAFLEEKQRSQNDDIYTDSQLIHLLNDLFIGGIETTVTTLSWYLLYMAVHQEIQTKVRQELLLTLNDGYPTLDDKPSLPFLEATLAEVARIRTVLPMSAPHSALEDIEVDNIRIPKGSMIVSLLWSVHMDPKLWKDPATFRPERFLDEEGRFHTPEAFIPFHTGQRMCAGKELAKMVSFLFAAYIMKCFQIDCEEDVVDLEGLGGVTLQPRPFKLRFTKL